MRGLKQGLEEPLAVDPVDGVWCMPRGPAHARPCARARQARQHRGAIEHAPRALGQQRGDAVGKLASIVSAHPLVRAALMQRQKRFAQQPGGAVLDGRDIGTVICPRAEAKLYVTARAEVRAHRRWLELSEKDPSLALEQVLADVEARDARDRDRTEAPLVAADDALVIDTSDLAIPEAVAKAVAHVQSRKDIVINNL